MDISVVHSWVEDSSRDELRRVAGANIGRYVERQSLAWVKPPTKLFLSNLGLTSLPEVFTSPSFQNMQYIILTGNPLKGLPDFSQIKSLTLIGDSSLGALAEALPSNIRFLSDWSASPLVDEGKPAPSCRFVGGFREGRGYVYRIQEENLMDRALMGIQRSISKGLPIPLEGLVGYLNGISFLAEEKNEVIYHIKNLRYFLYVFLKQPLVDVWIDPEDEHLLKYAETQMASEGVSSELCLEDLFKWMELEQWLFKEEGCLSSLFPVFQQYHDAVFDRERNGVLVIENIFKRLQKIKKVSLMPYKEIEADFKEWAEETSIKRMTFDEEVLDFILEQNRFTENPGLVLDRLVLFFVNTNPLAYGDLLQKYSSALVLAKKKYPFPPWDEIQHYSEGGMFENAWFERLQDSDNESV